MTRRWIALFLTPAIRLAAQQPTPSPEVIELIRSTVLETAAEHSYLRSSSDTGHVPLRVTVPGDDPSGTWRRLGDALFTSLRGRPVTAADDGHMEVVLSRIRIRPDTVQFGLRIVLSCAPPNDKWTFGFEHEISRVRTAAGWHAHGPDGRIPYDVIACRRTW